MWDSNNIDVIEILDKSIENVALAAAAYFGYAKSYKTIDEAFRDAQIGPMIMNTVEECSIALAREFDIPEAVRLEHSEMIVGKHKNPAIILSIKKAGSNPALNIMRDSGLIKTALLARKHGIFPYYMYKTVAYAFMYHDQDDISSADMSQFIRQYGIDQAIRNYTHLTEQDVIYNIKRHYSNANGKFTGEDEARVRLIKQAYQAGFNAERDYHGCAQCTLLAMSEATGVFDKDMFRAATGLAGGMALCGDGVCGGYSGGILFMGSLRGRDFDRMLIDGDKENKNMAYECAQMLHDYFIDCFNSVICMKIHEKMFLGEHYILRTKERREEFELAGAHENACTTVVALASSWIIEILLDKNIIKLD